MRGLKYDQKSDIFTARCLYKVLNKDPNEIDEIEEKMVVTEEWVKLTGYAKGVVGFVKAQRKTIQSCFFAHWDIIKHHKGNHFN